MEDGEPELRGIQETAEALGITMRTLRFYEDRGLIEPHRIGTARVYTRREMARMQLILRGKRLGFSLRDIREFLDLYEVDPRHIEQMRALAERCRMRIDELEKQQAALLQTLTELTEIEHQALERLIPPAVAAKHEEPGSMASA